jgi:carbonic anhydrase
VRFGYSGKTGPKHWGSLSPNFTLCSKGIYQSPIDIVKDFAVHNPKMEPLERDYTAANVTMVDNVFNIAVCSEPLNQTVIYVNEQKIHNKRMTRRELISCS